MKYTLLLILLTVMPNASSTLFDFTPDSKIDTWQVVDDGVMGGRSQGNFFIDTSGNGVFEGHVSLANNGGFSSVQYLFAKQNVEEFTHFTIRLKGDGKDYQFRVKNTQQDRHSYIYTFPTSGEWEVITILFAEMRPQFRGNKLNMSNYIGKYMEQVTFLVGNKKEEDFRLVLDKIGLK